MRLLWRGFLKWPDRAKTTFHFQTWSNFDDYMKYSSSHTSKLGFVEIAAFCNLFRFVMSVSRCFFRFTIFRVPGVDPLCFCTMHARTNLTHVKLIWQSWRSGSIDPMLTASTLCSYSLCLLTIHRQLIWTGSLPLTNTMKWICCFHGWWGSWGFVASAWAARDLDPITLTPFGNFIWIYPAM